MLQQREKVLMKDVTSCQKEECTGEYSPRSISSLDALLDNIVRDGCHGLCLHILNHEALAGLRNAPLGLWWLLCIRTLWAQT